MKFNQILKEAVVTEPGRFHRQNDDHDLPFEQRQAKLKQEPYTNKISELVPELLKHFVGSIDFKSGKGYHVSEEIQQYSLNFKLLNKNTSQSPLISTFFIKTTRWDPVGNIWSPDCSYDLDEQYSKKHSLKEASYSIKDLCNQFKSDSKFNYLFHHIEMMARANGKRAETDPERYDQKLYSAAYFLLTKQNISKFSLNIRSAYGYVTSTKAVFENGEKCHELDNQIDVNRREARYEVADTPFSPKWQEIHH